MLKIASSMQRKADNFYGPLRLQMMHTAREGSEAKWKGAAAAAHINQAAPFASLPAVFSFFFCFLFFLC